MRKSLSFFIALVLSLSLFACQNEEVSSAAEVSEKEAAEENQGGISSFEASLSNEMIMNNLDLVVEPAVWSNPSGEAFPISDVLIAEPQDINRLTINSLGSGFEKELILEGEAAIKASAALLNSKIYNLNVGVTKSRRGDSYLFTMESKDGNILTIYDSSYVYIKGHDMPYARLDELRIPMPLNSEFETYEMDLTTGLRKTEESEENPYLDYLGKNLYPADYCTVSMEEGRIFAYLCGNINEYDEVLRKSVLDGCKNIGDAEIIILSANLSSLQEYYPMMKEINRKIKELKLDDKLLVRLKNDRMQIFGNADDDLSEFLDWLSTYGGRNSIVVRLN